MALGFTEPLTNEYQKIFFGSKVCPVLRADNLTGICEPIAYATSHNPIGLHGMIQG
jgi:hypothetical protein